MRLTIAVLMAFGAFASFAETLRVSGDVTIPDGGASYDGIVFDANGTLSGGAITLGEDGVVVRPGVTGRVSAKLSGDCDFTVNGGGEIHFSGANDFGGKMTVSNVTFYAESDSAFGTPDGVTLFQSARSGSTADTKVYFCGVNTAEEIWWFGNTGSDTLLFYFQTQTSNTFNGKFIQQPNVKDPGRAGANFLSGSKVDFLSTVGPLDYSDWKGSANSRSCCEVNFGGSIKAARVTMKNGVFGFARYTGSTTAIGSDSWQSAIRTTWKMLSPYVLRKDASATYVTDASGVYQNFLQFPTQVGDTAVTLDLNGCDQLFETISQKKGTDVSGGVVTSASAAVLRLANTITTGGTFDFATKFRDWASLSLEGPRQMVYKGISDTSGYLQLTNEASLTMSSESSWAGKDVRIYGGSKLTVNGAEVFSKDTVIVLTDVEKDTVMQFAKLQLGTQVALSKFIVNGRELAAGEWGSTASGAANRDDDHFAGTGKIVVGDISFGTSTWDGGAAENTSIRETANWENDKAPDFTSGYDTAIFAKAGDRATVDADVSFLGLQFDTPAEVPSFILDGTETVAVGAGGVKFKTSDVNVRKYEISAPLQVAGSQMWSVDAGVDVALTGPFAVAAGTTLTLNCATGTPVSWCGDSLDCQGEFVVNQGYNIISNGASFGVAGASVRYSRANGSTSADKIVFSGVTMSADVKIVDTDTGNAPDKSALFLPWGTTNVFNGAFCFEGVNNSYLGIQGRTKTVFAGGFTFNNNAGQYMFSGRVGAESENKGAVVVITNKPANVKRLLFGSGLVPDSLLELHSQCTSTSEFCLKGGIIRCFCENAYYGANGQGSECKQPSNNYTGGFHVDGGFFDLNGYDQRCGAFHSLSLENKTGYQQYTTHSSGSAAAQIHSPTPATFHVCNQLDFTTNATPFTGAASLALDGGSGLLVLANPSPTTGGLTVNSTSGTLELSSSATWPNASKVELLAGTLKLAAIERQLGRKAAWYVKDGKVEIPSGVTLKGGALWLYDGEKGVYVEQKGRSVYNAGNCDFVTGGGSLEVGKGGLILLFR